MKFAFVGTGMIGSGLAVNAALRGQDVVLYDVAEPETVKGTVGKVLDILVEAGAVDRERADETLSKMSFTKDLAEAVTGADFVQECVPEKLELKHSTYRQIQEICGDSTVIASSTSGMFPSALAEGALYPERIIVGHPYNPSYLLPLIEICGPHAPQETIDRALEAYRAMGKEPVVCRKEVTGFIVNSLSWGVMDGAIDKVLDGVCDVEDVDKAIMYGPGLRMAVTGQLLTMSMGVQGGFREMAEKYGKTAARRPDQIVGKDTDRILRFLFLTIEVHVFRFLKAVDQSIDFLFVRLTVKIESADPLIDRRGILIGSINQVPAGSESVFHSPC